MRARPGQWRERHRVILEILRTEPIHSQTELLVRLRRRGCRVTQPSVSRDLAELRVAKLDGRYVPAPAGTGPAPGAAGPDAGALDELAHYLQRCTPAGPNLLVLRTPPGRAPLVALAIDQCGWREVVGTLAGDDVVFAATAGRRQQARVLARLAPLLEGRTHA
ncbi:MAG: arginine repressor [Deltaproteobacteria bacterium]|nr:arginine repressor [Deltaproteobacteria bacterium]